MDDEPIGMQTAITKQRQQREVTRRNFDVSQDTPPCSFRRLPPELLSDIMMLSHVGDGVGTNYLGQMRSVFILSWVCQEWRSIALATPRLWTTVKLGYHPGQQVLWENSMVLANLCLSRVEQLPLSLAVCLAWDTNVRPDIDSNNAEFDEKQAKYGELLEALKPFFRHSQHIRFLLSDYIASSHFDGPVGEFPLLESLSISYIRDSDDDDSDDDERDDKMTLFSSCPRLRVLHLGERIHTSYLRLAYSMLREVKMNSGCLRDFIEILQLSPDLTCLTVEYLAWREEHSDFQIVTHQHLTKLHMTTSLPIAVFFTSVLLPSLQVFSLEMGDGVWPQTQLLQFLSSPSSTLRKLSLNSFSLYEPQMLEILCLTPRLEVLLLARGPSDIITGKLWNELDSKLNTIPLVPRLRTLGVWAARKDFDGLEFAQMVASRWYANGVEVAQLCALKVTNLPSLDEKCIEMLLSLQKEGLYIHPRSWSLQPRRIRV